MAAPMTKWRPNDVITCTSKLGKLVQEHEEVRGKVSEEIVNLIISGTARLMASFGTQTDKHGDSVAVGKGQLQIRSEGAEILRVYRQAISSVFAGDAGTKSEFGIGLHVNPRSANSVWAGLERFITAAEASPEKAAAVHLSAEDLAKMKELREKVIEGKKSQGEMATNAMSSTLERRKLQAEIEAAVIKVVAAASVIYRKQPELVALFKSTLPKKRRGSRKTGKDESGDSTTSDSTSTDTNTDTE